VPKKHRIKELGSSDEDNSSDDDGLYKKILHHLNK